MNLGKNWAAWLGIGLAAIALLITVSGWSFGSMLTNGAGSLNMPQAYSQQSGQSQNSMPHGRSTSNANTMPGTEQQRAGMGRGGKQAANGGFGFGPWFGFAFKLFNGLRNIALIVLLTLLAVVLLRGRGVKANHPAEPPQAAVPEQRSPTGESYRDESNDSKS